MTSCHTDDYSFVQHFERAHYYSDSIGQKIQPPYAVLNMSSYICRVSSTEPGALERHNESLVQIVPHITASINGCGYGLDDLAWAELAFFRGDFSRAEGHLQTTLKKAREMGQYETENCALFLLLRICLCRGNGEAVPDLLWQIEKQQENLGYINRLAYQDIIMGWFYVQTGRPEKIASWLKNDFEENDLYSEIHELEVIVKAKYYFAKKRYPPVLAELESLDSVHKTLFLMGKLEAKVLEAVCRYRSNDVSGAFHNLEDAWELAQGNGLYTPFMELGKDMRALAGAALKEGAVKIPKPELEKIRRNAALYAKNIFAVSKVLPVEQPKAGTKNRTGTALSKRELDVLTGLSQGLTREEIARVHSISINTVKSAARSVYNKLGAVNRADAVRIATELEIL
jgi:LuxR family maltose regulon positive regulatory protein